MADFSFANQQGKVTQTKELQSNSPEENCSQPTGPETTQPNAKFAKRMLQEQAQIKKRKHNRERHDKLREAREEEETHRLLLEQHELQEQDKLQRRAGMQQKAALRRQDATSLKEFAHSSPRDKPLFKKLEEAYKEAFELPELQRRKEALAQKRGLFSAQKQQEILRHLPPRPRPQLPSRSTVPGPILPSKLLTKQQKYSKHVKSAHRPRIDPLKFLEAEVKKRKSELPLSLKRPLVSLRNPPVPRFPAPPPQQPKAPPTPPQKKDCEYLKQRRAIRNKLEKDFLCAKEHRVDPARPRFSQEAKRKEGLLKHNYTPSPFSPELLVANQHINELYIHSIRAKLNCLE